MHCWKQQQAQPRQEARSMLMQGLHGALACRVSKGVGAFMGPKLAEAASQRQPPGAYFSD